jgi:hypothetical protein
VSNEIREAQLRRLARDATVSARSQGSDLARITGTTDWRDFFSPHEILETD